MDETKVLRQLRIFIVGGFADVARDEDRGIKPWYLEFDKFEEEGDSLVLIDEATGDKLRLVLEEYKEPQ